MKTLIIIAHPDIDASIANKNWLEAVEKHPEDYTIHELYKVYPDEKINIEREQQLLLEYDQVVLQFPVYWFSSPPLLKKWLDEVFLSGFSYGKNGFKLAGKKFALAVTAGIREYDYHTDGRYFYTLEQILVPFAATFIYCKIDYRSFFAIYGKETPDYAPPTTDNDLTAEELQKSATDYLKFLRAI